jgi:hypothetical protein
VPTFIYYNVASTYKSSTSNSVIYMYDGSLKEWVLDRTMLDRDGLNTHRFVSFKLTDIYYSQSVI